jgi:hypothetical protein
MAGNFSIFNRNQLIENLSFNYNRTESDLENVNPGAVSDFKEINNVNSIFDTLQANRADNQIWKWFLLLTFLFVALEILIQKFVK